MFGEEKAIPSEGFGLDRLLDDLFEDALRRKRIIGLRRVFSWIVSRIDPHELYDVRLVGQCGVRNVCCDRTRAVSNCCILLVHRFLPLRRPSV